jgi:hypothetical protein
MYNPDDPRTYLKSLALSRSDIVKKLLLTTLLGVIAAFVVAFHQMAAGSGH